MPYFGIPIRNGLPIGLGSVAGFGAFQFSPSVLFTAGEQGAWYDPSDFTTLFQDAAGTTPTTMETRARLMLDKSGRGNHATAPSDADSPILRARYNLLTHSEDFSNAAWVKTNATIVANAATAPDGTSTATLIYPTTTGANRGAYTSAAIVAGPYIGTIYAKASGLQSIRMVELLGSSIAGIIDLGTGAVSSVLAGYTVTTTSVGAGWWLISFSATVTAGTRFFQFVITDNAATSTATTNGTDGVLVWHPDLRLTTDAALNIPAYQSITTATSYDTNGFPPYLAFDGTDDSFSTASIDFTGTPQMTVFAGVTKLSDAAQGVVVELSAAIASNNGAFLLAAPDGATQTFGWDSKGTLQVDAVATSQAAPRNAVLTGIGDIGADICTIRVNGAQADTDTGDQGSGNYANAAVFIGRTNNTSAPLNGRIYSLIIRGAATTTPLIASTEQWVAGKMRLPI